VASLEGQLALEREMLQIGADAFASRMNKRREQGMESLSTHGDALAAMGVDRIIQDLRKHRHAMRDGRAGRGYAHMGPLLQLAPHKIAAVAMRVVIDQLTQAPKFQALAYSLAERLWLETMLARASEYELKKHQRVRRRFMHKRADAMRMKNSEIWTPQEKLSVGVFLVHLVESHTGLIEIYQERGAMRSVKHVRATQAALEWVRSAEDQQRLLCPFALPTIVPPRDWSDPLTGGYWTEGLPGNTLFKSNCDDIAAQSSEFDAFLVAANIQQGVAWRINGWMLDQVTHAWDRSLSIGNLLPRSGHAIPPYPKHLPDDHDDVTAWRHTAKQLHDRNDREAGKRFTSAKQLWVARRLRDEPALYFPVQCDFRGRYYYRPPYLQPQANDTGRSLLQFANGTPINTEAEADWLRIHGANTYGHNKLTWAGRIAWVHEHQLEIEATGREPWCNQEFWAGAKDPWQFLAFCREYQQFSPTGWAGCATTLSCWTAPAPASSITRRCSGPRRWQPSST
jgi:DNA-directed RNA polymerase, mitochondrial